MTESILNPFTFSFKIIETKMVKVDRFEDITPEMFNGFHQPIVKKEEKAGNRREDITITTIPFSRIRSIMVNTICFSFETII